MTDIIRHRGPDDEGFVLTDSCLSKFHICGNSDTPSEAYRFELPYAPREALDSLGDIPITLALGHRRLSIIDVSPLGHQPMCSLDGRYWIIYNGEVYNFIELRLELEQCGHRFVSQTDTEVILAAFAEWGEKCLHRFNGMWAFAIYDTHRKSLFLARDRFGVKPLYYWISSASFFAFGSEIKQFSVIPGWKARMNPGRIYDFLAFGASDHTEETMFDGVYQLKPGHYTIIDALNINRLKPDRPLPSVKWYHLFPAPFDGSFEEAESCFRDYFEQSVTKRLRADVPIGSCLSGGLDSSSIVCVVNSILRRNDAQALQKTFSACAEVERFDERKWIDIVVKATGVQAYYVYPSLDQLFNESPLITWHQDEPFGSTSIYAQWNVFRLAAENDVKVMLDGQGADEQLAGYHSFFTARFTDLFAHGRLLQLWREIQCTKKLHGRNELLALSGIAYSLLPVIIGDCIRKLSRFSTTPAWLNSKRLKCDSMSFNNFSSMRSKSIQNHSLSQLIVTNLPMLLHWEDRNSMAHGIEARVPFLDYQLVEFVLGLPEDYKLLNGVTKRVLRHAMSSLLPSSICNRMDKLGFVTPEEIWMRKTAPELFRSKIQKAIGICNGIISEEILSTFDQMVSSRKKFDFSFWRILSLSEWISTFSVKS